MALGAEQEGAFHSTPERFITLERILSRLRAWKPTGYNSSKQVRDVNTILNEIKYKYYSQGTTYRRAHH